MRPPRRRNPSRDGLGDSLPTRAQFGRRDRYGSRRTIPVVIDEVKDQLGPIDGLATTDAPFGGAPSSRGRVSSVPRNDVAFSNASTDSTAGPDGEGFLARGSPFSPHRPPDSSRRALMRRAHSLPLLAIGLLAGAALFPAPAIGQTAAPADP